MTLANRAVEVMVIAMLALAVWLLWPAASAFHAHVHGVATEASHDHAAHQDSRPDDANHIDCEPSAIGCCMTLCHPPLAIEPNHLSFMDMDGRTEPAMAARVFASLPDVVDPPPRSSLSDERQSRHMRKTR